MRAAVFHGRDDVRIEDVADPVVGPRDLLLKVAAVGICGTDGHEFAHGPTLFPIEVEHPVTHHCGPLIPGHEIAGWVQATGAEVSDFATGMLVVSGAGISCGQCHWCAAGRTNLCANYSTVGLQCHGGLAQYVAVPSDTCIDTGPYGLTPDAAALAQPMSIAVHAMRRGRPRSGEVVVVIGAGGIGAFLTYALAQFGAVTVVADLNPQRLAVAKSLGAHTTVIPEDGQGLGQVLSSQGLVPSVIYEVSGSTPGFDLARSIVPRGGRIVLVGLHGQPCAINLRDISIREIEIIGTNAHVLRTDLPMALDLLATRTDGWRDVAPIALSLDSLVDGGLKPLAAGQSDQIKTLVDPWSDLTRSTLC